MRAITLNDLETLETEVLTPKQVAVILETNPQSIRVQAAECPEMLGFNVIRIGKTTLIPRQAFINFMKGINKGPTAGTADPMPQTTGEKGQL